MEKGGDEDEENKEEKEKDEKKRRTLSFATDQPTGKTTASFTCSHTCP